MRSRFSIGGHPLHPILVSLPIGLFVWALVADVIYLAGGRLVIVRPDTVLRSHRAG